jgi:ribosome-binding ATPase YchF (GTP1/OBG family)
MKIGIIGLPQVGKKTLFELLTGEKLNAHALAGKEEIILGAAKIRDARFDKLTAMYKPKKNVPATLDVILLPKFDKDTISSGECLKAVEKCDALCHIVRAFADESVFHVDGSVAPLRDIENVFAELVLSDLILIEKRLERLEKEVRLKNDAQQVKEKIILEEMKKTLDKFNSL